jgi:transposase
MAGKLPMGSKELIRVKLMGMVAEKQLTLMEAAIRMKVGYRQSKRIYSAYRGRGEAGLLHGNQGKPSNHRIDEEIKAAVVEAYRNRYPDFGPTFAAEKIKEKEGISVDHETLRRWLMEAGLWKRKRRSKEYRSRRDRRERFGELVQFDGSHHDWFEGRRGKCCLMNMVDDATGTTLSMLYEQETTVAAMELLWAWIKKYGIPQAVYCDRKNAFVLDREPTIEQQLRGEEPKSPFELACEKLGIEVIVANSPQAKGRVERNHGVYQDRFVKELRLAGISTIEEANAFLETIYLPKINARFSLPASDKTDAHVPLVDGTDLREVFCFENDRKVSNDYIVMFERRCFQISSDAVPRPRPRDAVIVRKRLDGSICILWKGKPLLFEELKIPLKKEARIPLSA